MESSSKLTVSPMIYRFAAPSEAETVAVAEEAAQVVPLTKIKTVAVTPVVHGMESIPAASSIALASSQISPRFETRAEVKLKFRIGNNP